ncbi:MAG: YihY/virulence factor BrkB family protein [Gaiellaceae bacterium]
MAENGGNRGPDHPGELEGRSWWAILKRTVKEFQDDNLTDWAAALTYYSVMSIFPMLIALVSILGLFGSESSVTSMINSLNAVGLSSIASSITKPLNDVVQHRSSAGILFVVGIVVALWSASGYIGAFMRASNAIYEVEEGRPFYKLRPLQLLVTLVMVVLLALIAIGLVITGPLTDAVGNLLGLGHTATTVFSIVKWPVMLVIVMAMFAGLYYVAPNVRQPKFRWVSPGGIVAVLIWIVASAAFGLYIAHFNNYTKTYGTLGTVISFLVWLWISNLALLFGAELDAELERERELKEGLPARDELQLPPRQPANR